MEKNDNEILKLYSKIIDEAYKNGGEASFEKVYSEFNLMIDDNRIFTFEVLGSRFKPVRDGLQCLMQAVGTLPPNDQKNCIRKIKKLINKKNIEYCKSNLIAAENRDKVKVARQLLTGRFTFHPIGQGMFYSGSLTKDMDTPLFNFIYDCGSKSSKKRLNEEIITYVRSVKVKELDLIVLSHLDADHVNGLPFLLDNVGCTTVVLPYLSQVERLFCYFLSIAKYGEGVDNGEYMDFLNNPYEYLINRGVKRVIIIYPVTENLTNNDVVDVPSDLKDLQDKYLGIIKVVQGNYFLDERFFHWNFHFYTAPQNKLSIDDFRKFVSKEIKVNIDKLDGNIIKDIFKKPALETFRVKFKESFGDFNTTGIVLIHYPEVTIKIKVSNSISRVDLNSKSATLYRTILNGDINLAERIKVLNKQFKDILVFQIPHHGSIKNWDSRILNYTSTKTLFIANYGKNNYKHPSRKVIKEINNFGAHSKLVKINKPFKYEIKIEWTA